MELLVAHIVVGVGALAAGIGAAVLARKTWLQAQLGLFALTILSGGLLVLAAPHTLGRVCVSAALLSLVSLALSLTARRRLATLAR
jgi:hypothetical protein